MRADKLHRIGDQLGRPRQQHLVLCIPTETVQAASRLRLDHHVDRILAVRPILVAHRAGRQITAHRYSSALCELRQELRHCLVPAERVEVVVAVHRSFVDRQLLQRRVQMVAQRPLQLCQLPACRELPVQRVAVARLITDDSMFLVLRQPIIPRGIPDVRILRRVLVRDVLHLIRVQRNVGIRAAPRAVPQGELFPYAGRLALAISSRLSGVVSL